MANVFSDIFEAIRTIRQKKGTTEADIMTYVHDRLGKGVSIRTVLKTMKTLNRLVEDGLLLKKGKRYLLPLPDTCPEKKEEKEDDCMEEDDDEENDEDNNEDEEDEEDDEDDDDDDDGGCNMEEDGNEGGNGDKKDPCEMDDDEPHGRKDGGADWDYKNIESKMKYMKSELNQRAGSFMRSKKQGHGARRNEIYEEEYDELSRTQSPARKSSDEIDVMMDVEEGLHESAGGAQFINSDLSFGYEEGDRPGHNMYRYKSPNGPPPPNTPGVHVERRESCCSDVVLKVDDLAEAESDLHGDGKSKQSEDGDKKQATKERQSKRRDRDATEEEFKKGKSLRRDDSEEKAKDCRGGTSICELCKKKKQPGYEVDCSGNTGNW